MNSVWHIKREEDQVFNLVRKKECVIHSDYCNYGKACVCGYELSHLKNTFVQLLPSIFDDDKTVAVFQQFFMRQDAILSGCGHI